MIEYITNIPVEKLKPFPNHPFQVRDDDSMRETVKSIKTYVQIPTPMNHLHGEFRPVKR